MLLSDSTERWDFADVTADKCRHTYYGEGFRKTRLSYHFERLGIWTALTFLGHSPDLLVEADLNAKALAGTKVLFVVGDHIPVRCVAAMERWVRAGGVLLATAGAGRFDEYGAPNPAMNRLLQLAERTCDEQVRFLRPRQELPFLKPLTHLTLPEGCRMPVLAVRETLRGRPGAESVYRGRFADGATGFLVHKLGKGRVYCLGALPGLAYLWTALQPPAVPDRGPGVHLVPERFDAVAREILGLPLAEADLSPPIQVRPGLYDTRLVASPKGFFLPIANYNRKVGGPATVSVRVGKPIRKVTSAHCGALKHETKAGRAVFTIPKLGYGDMIRLDP